MFYSSEMPKIVGEFDAAALHRRIDSVADGLPGYAVAQRLASEQALKYPSMQQIAGIKWSRLFRSNAFASCTIDGQTDDLEKIYAYKSPVDKWHVDTLDDNRYLVLPDILTTASRWPTIFAVGKIALPPGVIKHHVEFGFWDSGLGAKTIDESVYNGDARLVKFLPGQVLKVPRGTIHKRDIPEEAAGSYRYFMRKFPEFSIGHAGTALGRCRVI